MILHYAHLCAQAGGVEAFCIGSEMRSLTQIRGAGHSFPAVQALRQLAAEVRGILGPAVKIGYAADWSEYFGYTHPNGNRYFHLDPLCAYAQIDFIGIDNYMPLADWRDGDDHLVIGVRGGQLHVEGDAYWPSANPTPEVRPYGPNMGQVEALAAPTGNTVVFHDATCTLRAHLLGDYLIVADNSECGGMNVRFNGVYRRAGSR